MNANLDELLNTRTRYVSILTYANEQEINETLKNHEKNIKAYAFILHDKDAKADGELKEAHFHVLLALHSATTPSAVIKWFKKQSDQNTFAEPVKTNIRLAYEYLTHTNDPDKYQYDQEEIKHGNIEYWLQVVEDDKDDENIGLLIVEDLLSGTDYYSMCVRYGREWIIYHERYEMMCRKIRDGWRP